MDDRQHFFLGRLAEEAASLDRRRPDLRDPDLAEDEVDLQHELEYALSSTDALAKLARLDHAAAGGFNSFYKAVCRAVRAEDDEWCDYLDDLEDQLDESGVVVVDAIRLEGDDAVRAVEREHERAWKAGRVFDLMMSGFRSRPLDYVPPVRGCHTASARPRGAGRPAGRTRSRRTARASSRGDPPQAEGDGDPPPPPDLSQLVILGAFWALTSGMSGPERLAAFERLPRWLQDLAYSELEIRSRGGWR